LERRIPVDDIDVDKVKASFKNGVLTVHLASLADCEVERPAYSH
jgi:HSP20 family molecular chaperone IbpA